MAKCPNCGADVSASDKRCSKCGAKLDNKNSSKLIIGIVIAVVIVAIVGAFASGVFTGNDATADSSDETADETVEPVSDDSSGSGDTEYWASAKAEKFHRPDCEWAQKISDYNKIVYDTREEAIADGKIPCGECNP